MDQENIPPLVWVKWEDATMKEDGTWFQHDSKTKHEYEPAVMHTVGFLLHKDDKGIIITHTWNTDVMAPRDQIPLGMVLDMGTLIPEKKARKCK